MLLFISYKFQTHHLPTYVIKNDKDISDRKLHSKYTKYTSFKMTTEVKSSYSNSAFTPNMIGHFELLSKSADRIKNTGTFL